MIYNVHLSNLLGFLVLNEDILSIPRAVHLKYKPISVTTGRGLFASYPGRLFRLQGAIYDR